MDDLKSFKEKLEANLLTLNKFEGLESDLIQRHGNLRAQFSEYREAIETTNLSEKEKKEHYGYHDELVKKLHKLILEAKALARKRTEQMTRDELFKLSQERQKLLKPQSAEDKIGDEVTKSLKRMLETMRTEVERSSSNISTAHQTTKNLKGTSENYEKLSGTLEQSRGLIRELWKKNRNDMIYIIGALGVFIATVLYVILQRTPGIVWLPGKLILRQLGNFVPKSSGSAGKFVERVVEMTEAVLSDSEDVPNMFIDKVLNKEEEYGNDELLKGQDEDKVTEPVIKEISESGRVEAVSGDEDSSAATEMVNNISRNQPVQTHVSATSTAEVRAIDEFKVETFTFTLKSTEKMKIMETVVMALKDDAPGTQYVIEIPAINTEKIIEEQVEVIEKGIVPEDPVIIQNIDANISQISKSGHALIEAQYSNEMATSDSFSRIETPIVKLLTATNVAEDPNVDFETPVIIEVPSTETSNVIINTHAPVQFTPAIEVVTSLNIVSTIKETLLHPEIQDSPATIIPTSAKIITESTYYTATESEIEGNQGIYSSEAELFSENKEKMEL